MAEADKAVMLDRLEHLFRARGAEAYMGEAVTVAEHMLQCAALGQAEGAPAGLVAAALLHDIGHLTGSDGEYSPDDLIDRAHERSGAAFLAGQFPPEVVEPIRLHVAAKRYLCATDPAYFDRLSPASKHSLQLQGGPMTGEEVAAFEHEPFHRDAIRIRRWDDTGKVPGLVIPTIGDFRALLTPLLG